MSRSSKRFSAGKRNGKGYSNVHIGQPRSQCALCGQACLVQYTQPKTWKDKSSFSFLQTLEPSLILSTESYICRLCREDLPKCKDKNHTPRWRKGAKLKGAGGSKCMVGACSHVAQVRTTLGTKEALETVFPHAQGSFSDDAKTKPLCKEHYWELYSHLHPPPRCKTCSKYIRNHSKARRCPNPEVVCKFLAEKNMDTGEIASTDHICGACYKAQLVMIRLAENKLTSTDEDLQVVFTNLKEGLENIGTISTAEEVITYAANTTAIMVGEKLLDQQAMLLPDINDMFQSEVRRILNLRGITYVEELPPAQWLRSKLSSMLDFHMAYECKIKKYGTVVHRCGGDLVHALNAALGQLRYHQHQSVKEPVGMGNEGQVNDFDAQLEHVCGILNIKIHDFIQRLIEQDARKPHDISEVSISDYTNSLDPQVWKAICLLTRPKAMQHANTEPTTVRQVRRFFCASALLFCTNSQCSFPIHILLTDIIQYCGGSARLIRILNRFGVCASADTHSRYVNYVIEQMEEEGILSAFLNEVLTIMSTDNLDYKREYAQRFCGRQESSWHGTTVQVVQPQPSVPLVANLVPQMLSTSNQLTVSSAAVTFPEPFRDPSGAHPVTQTESPREPPGTVGVHAVTHTGPPREPPGTVGVHAVTHTGPPREPPGTVGVHAVTHTGPPREPPGTVGVHAVTHTGPPREPSEAAHTPTITHTGPPREPPGTVGVHAVTHTGPPREPSEAAHTPTITHTGPPREPPGTVGVHAVTHTGPLREPSEAAHTPTITHTGPPREPPGTVGVHAVTHTGPLREPSEAAHTPTITHTGPPREPPGTAHIPAVTHTGPPREPLGTVGVHAVTHTGPPREPPGTVGVHTVTHTGPPREPPGMVGVHAVTHAGLSGEQPGTVETGSCEALGTTNHPDISVDQIPIEMDTSECTLDLFTESMDTTDFPSSQQFPSMNTEIQHVPSSRELMGMFSIDLTCWPSVPTADHTQTSATIPNIQQVLSERYSSTTRNAPFNNPVTCAENTANTVSTTHDDMHRHPLSPAQGTLQMRLCGYKRSFAAVHKSPNKPMKVSPKIKKTRRMRTGTEGCRRKLLQPDEQLTLPVHRQYAQSQHVPEESFRVSDDDRDVLQELKKIGNSFILHKLAHAPDDSTFVEFQTYFSLLQDIQPPEPSNVLYHSVLDQKADDNGTLLTVVNTLHKDYIVAGKKEWVILEGDAAVYQRLQNIKAEYGHEMDWLIPIPGDWHTLKNYQEVLLKIYLDAGLSDLARASGYNPNGLGSQFQRTHDFLIETWEAMYRHFLSSFLQTPREGTGDSHQEFLQYVSMWLRNFPTSQNQQQCLRNVTQLLSEEEEKYPNWNENFQNFMQTQSSKSQTWKFWSQFVFEDCLAYVGLFLAIRSGNWKLRLASIKSMAALFTAFDRPTYQKLIAQHITDLHNMPAPVLTALRQGGFSVSLTGRPCHSVAIDEAHEMCINKDCKEFITKPTSDNINRMSKFLAHRAKAIKNLEQQIFPEKVTPSSEIRAMYTTLPVNSKHELNVRSQEAKLAEYSSLTLDGITLQLHHIFSKKEVSAEQAVDLLSFREIGQKEFEHRVEYFVLRNPSVQAPRRRKRLLTFSERETTRKKVSDVEKERKLQLECWKKKIAFASKTGASITNVFEQYIELPRAIATPDGLPNKGNKANTTKVYTKRYEHAITPVVRSAFPSGWRPDVVIIEGMFIINTTPWAAHFTMAHYAEFLKSHHILPHFGRGALEVHVLFDDPENEHTSPKHFERLRRANTSPCGNHTCVTFSRNADIPKKWRDNVLNCKVCKRQLVVFLSEYFINTVGMSLSGGQRFVTASGFDESDKGKAYSVGSEGNPEPDPRLACNAEETDTRLWLHVKSSTAKRKLIISPDTDVYHIGLPLVANADLDILVKLSPMNSTALRLLDVKALLDAFSNDPDLASLHRNHIPNIMQMMYICTGCDFISFFHGLGKASFLNTLYNNANFITSEDSQPPGTLAYTEPTSETGLLAFMRLVGCAYYHKYKSAFHPAYLSPVTHFNSFARLAQTPYHHHSLWLRDVRERIWSKVKYEEEMIPSDEALRRHWNRSCWVAHTWSQANQQVMDVKPLHGNGWLQSSQKLTIDWDSPQNLEQVRMRVALIQKGCTCKTGCRNARCGCVKRHAGCGPGCTCLNCCNVETMSAMESQENNDTQQLEDDTAAVQTVLDIAITESIGVVRDIELEGSEDIDDIMNLVFGEWDDITSDTEDTHTHTYETEITDQSI